MKIGGFLHLNPLENYLTKKTYFYAFFGTNIYSTINI